MPSGQAVGHERVDERVLGREHHVGRAEERVGAGGEDLDPRAGRSPSTAKATRAPSLRPIQLRCIVLTDSGQSTPVEIVEQPVGVGGDPQHPLAQGALKTGKLPRSERPSVVTSSLASTVPRPGHQLTGASLE